MTRVQAAAAISTATVGAAASNLRWILAGLIILIFCTLCSSTMTTHLNSIINALRQRDQPTKPGPAAHVRRGSRPRKRRR